MANEIITEIVKSFENIDIKKATPQKNNEKFADSYSLNNFHIVQDQSREVGYTEIHTMTYIAHLPKKN